MGPCAAGPGAPRLRPSPGRGCGSSWVPLAKAVLTRLFLRSGSHGQFKRPERSFTLETEEPTGALSPLAPGESDQCPRQGPCRLQPGYDQPGLFQGKKLAGISCGQTDGWAGTPSPHPSVTPQTQGIKETSKAVVSLLWAETQETDRHSNSVDGVMDMKTGQRKEEKKLGHRGQNPC